MSGFDTLLTVPPYLSRYAPIGSRSPDCLLSDGMSDSCHCAYLLSPLRRMRQLSSMHSVPDMASLVCIRPIRVDWSYSSPCVRFVRSGMSMSRWTEWSGIGRNVRFLPHPHRSGRLEPVSEVREPCTERPLEAVVDRDGRIVRVVHGGVQCPDCTVPGSLPALHHLHQLSHGVRFGEGAPHEHHQPLCPLPVGLHPSVSLGPLRRKCGLCGESIPIDPCDHFVPLCPFRPLPARPPLVRLASQAYHGRSTPLCPSMPHYVRIVHRRISLYTQCPIVVGYALVCELCPPAHQMTW